MSNFFNRITNMKKKVNTSTKNEKMESEGIIINMKGQRVNQNIENNNMNSATYDFELQGREKGPPMLNMKTRAKVWGSMFVAGIYFYLCYKLIIYRLKSDDLDLMEREVSEEFKLKTKLKEINNIK